jgi:hypothetical protein
MSDTHHRADVPQPQHPGQAWAEMIAARFREGLTRCTPEGLAASERAAQARRDRRQRDDE